MRFKIDREISDNDFKDLIAYMQKELRDGDRTIDFADTKFSELNPRQIEEINRVIAGEIAHANKPVEILGLPEELSRLISKKQEQEILIGNQQTKIINHVLNVLEKYKDVLSKDAGLKSDFDYYQYYNYAERHKDQKESKGAVPVDREKILNSARPPKEIVMQQLLRLLEKAFKKEMDAYCDRPMSTIFGSRPASEFIVHLNTNEEKADNKKQYANDLRQLLRLIYFNTELLKSDEENPDRELFEKLLGVYEARVGRKFNVVKDEIREWSGDEKVVDALQKAWTGAVSNMVPGFLASLREEKNKKIDLDGMVTEKREDMEDDLKQLADFVNDILAVNKEKVPDLKHNLLHELGNYTGNYTRSFSLLEGAVRNAMLSDSSMQVQFERVIAKHKTDSENDDDVVIVSGLRSPSQGSGPGSK